MGPAGEPAGRLGAAPGDQRGQGVLLPAGGGGIINVDEAKEPAGKALERLG
ncbi:hypothetical protein [Actinoplanes subglobosus]|uniref:Uncharacterized protein n=1 Tax=Actinoplanes subglobosus TaxID=1547892 RepID=A0ABV8J4D3_9ACTN